MYSNDNTSSPRLLIMGDEFLVWSIAVWYRSAYSGCREKISLFLCFIIIAMGASNQASKIADWQADQSVEKCNRITHFCAPVRPSIGRSAVGARSLLYLSSSPGWWPWWCRAVDDGAESTGSVPRGLWSYSRRHRCHVMVRIGVVVASERWNWMQCNVINLLMHRH